MSCVKSRIIFGIFECRHFVKNILQLQLFQYFRRAGKIISAHDRYKVEFNFNLK